MGATLGRTSLFVGEEARDKLHELVGRALEQDATGGIYGHSRNLGELELSDLRNFIRPGDGFDRWSAWLCNAQYELIVVESGNSSGDSWKYVYHPLINAGMFCVETDL